jgi:MSHA biogenesis protein MshQ
MEAQTVTLTDISNFTPVTFQQVFDVVPAVFVLASEENPDPTTIRIRNVTTSGFELAQVEPPGSNSSGVTSSMTVQYLAAEPGSYVLDDGTALEVGTLSTDRSIYRNNSATWEDLSYASGFGSTPVLLSQVQTMNNETGVPPISQKSQPWLTAVTRNVSSSGFQLIMERSEVNDGSVSSNETVAWLAIESGVNSSLNAVAGPVPYVTARTSAVRGWGNSGSCYTVSFGATLATPHVFAGKNERGNNNGGWLRRCSLTSGSAGLVIDEDLDRDGERNHGSEDSSYIALGDAFTYELVTVPQACETYRDEFSSRSYTNNDGSLNWSGNWVEQDSGGGAATGGQVNITNGGILRLQGNNQFAYANVNKITREADLGSYATATFTFDYDASSNTIDGDDEIWVQVSSDGGANFTTLEAFVGRSSGSRSYDITGFMSSVTQVRFAIAQDDNSGGCCYGAGNEWFEVDNVEIEGCGASLLLVDHYAISAATTSLTCEPVSVTVSAHDGNHLPVNPINATVVDLSTSTGRGLWSGSSLDNGAVSYTFDGSTSAFTLSLLHAVAGSVNIDINGGLADSGAVGEDPDILFVDSGLRFIDAGGNPIATQVSAKPSGGYFLEAVRKDDASQQCVALFSNQSVNVNFAAECESPAGCTDADSNGSADYPLSLTYNSSTIAVPTTNEDSGPLASAWSALQLVSFAADGRAPISLRYDDAGRINLHARLELRDQAGNPSGEFIDGTSNFLVKPAGLCVMARDMDAGGPRNPQCGSGDASCSIYMEAGASFDLEVSARAWVNDAETNSDFCDNNTTPNFLLGGINLTPSLVAPVTGVNGSLSISSASVVTDGEAVLNQTVNEVGVFTITATPSINYFTEVIPASTSANIGRFLPAWFVLENPLVQPGAGTLSYLDQPVNAAFDIRAANAAGTTTVNYVDDFIKLDLTTDLGFGAVNDAAGTPLSLDTRISAGAPSFTWGSGEAIVAAIPLTLARDAVVDGPFGLAEIGLVFADSDGVTLQASALDLDTDLSGSDERQLIHAGSLDFRYGRVYTPPVYGPEIPVAATTDAPFFIQYWDGSGFITNTDDSSSPYDGFIWTSLANCYDVDGSDSLACSDTTVNIPLAATAMNGQGVLSVDRPGSSGVLNMEVEVDPWFRFDWQDDWDNDSLTVDDIHPFFQLNFGSFRSHDRIIYWRER